MKSGLVQQLNVPLSHLIPSRRNPRKVKASRDAHQRLVALISSQGLLQPLVVRPIDGKPKHYEVVAGERRLRALKEIHRSDGDPKIPCVLRDVDTATADAMSLGENFGREAMHPLDEAECGIRIGNAVEQFQGCQLAFGSRPKQFYPRSDSHRQELRACGASRLSTPLPPSGTHRRDRHKTQCRSSSPCHPRD